MPPEPAIEEDCADTFREHMRIYHNVQKTALVFLYCLEVMDIVGHPFFRTVRRVDYAPYPLVGDAPLSHHVTGVTGQLEIGHVKHTCPTQINNPLLYEAV